MKGIPMSSKIVRSFAVACGMTALAAGISVPAQAQGTNLALGKPASQSSLSAWSTGPRDAQGAVDGIKNGRFGFHTNVQPNPWWQVDLQQTCTLNQIQIFNRLDYASRAFSIQILLSSDGANWQTFYSNNGQPFGGTDGKPLVVNMRGAQTRFVKLQLTQTEYFHLDEVEIYGTASGSTPPPPPAARGNFDGYWDTNHGVMALVQNGSRVEGEYALGFGYVEGEVRGNVLTGYWEDLLGSGTFRFELAGKSFRGEWWNEDGSYGGRWDGSYLSPVVSP